MTELEKAMPPVDAPLVQPREEPTLGRALRTIAYDQWPSRFYQCLQLGIPAAFQLWQWGYYRSAGWMVVLSTFGIWALCEQTLRRDNEDAPAVTHSRARTIALRVGRRTAALVAGLAGLGLLFEGFTRLISTLSGCPGCAG